MLLNSFFSKTKALEINGTKYFIEEQIGEGAFGYVYKVKDISSNYYAIKKMICQISSQIDEAQKEINLLNSIQHKNVLQLINSCLITSKSSENVEVYLLLPLFQESLQRIIDSGVGYPECSLGNRYDIQKIIIGCTNGIHAVHSAGYRHGDIKPANILLDSERNPVITDFGSAEPLLVEVSSRQQALAIQDNASSKTTASFRAPELFDTPSHCIIDGKSDVWGLGCTFFATLFSRTPFEAPIEGLSVLAVMSGNFSFPSSSTWPPEYHTLISACLRVDLEQRLSIEDLKLLAGILPDPVEYLNLLTPLGIPTPVSTPAHKEVKSERFGQLLLKKLTSKDAVVVQDNQKYSDSTNGGDPSLTSFADFEHFPEPSPSSPSEVVKTLPAVSDSTPPPPPAPLTSMTPSTPSESISHSSSSTKHLSNINDNHSNKEISPLKLTEVEAEDEDEEWNFQSCEDTLLTVDKSPDPITVSEVKNESFGHPPDLIPQESEDFEFGDFQAADKDVPEITQQPQSQSQSLPQLQPPSLPQPLPQQPPIISNNSKVNIDREDSVESFNSKLDSIELSGSIFMMRTRRGLLLKQRMKKKLWMILRGNRITIQKTSDHDAKIHFHGLLSRTTTSIRPINSADLGRHTLLFEGVQILPNERRHEQGLGSGVGVVGGGGDDDDLIDEQLQQSQRERTVGVGGGAKTSSGSHTSSQQAVTINMEIGFDSREDIERWLQITQDIIN